MGLRLFCLFLVCLSLPGGLLVDGGEIRNITVRGYWKRIFEGENSDGSPSEYTAKCFHGLETEEDDEGTVTVKDLDPKYFGLSEGDRLKILLIDFGNEGQGESFQTLKESDIRRQKERTLKFTVHPGQKIVKWQFVVNIAGNEYAHSMILTYADDETPRDFDVTLTVHCVKIIRFGYTRIRIKHRTSNRYLTIVQRGSWPAATTGVSRYYHFILYNYGTDGLVIKTLSTTHTGYEYLSSWALKGGWIYANLFKTYSVDKNLYWAVCRRLPLYDGDVVTFRSEQFRHAFLCRSSQMEAIGEDNDNSVTDVFICQNHEDEWILEVV